MFESFIIGFLLGIISMLDVFPVNDHKANFWNWILSKLRRG
jgi:hypothetical protein